MSDFLFRPHLAQFRHLLINKRSVSLEVHLSRAVCFHREDGTKRRHRYLYTCDCLRTNACTGMVWSAGMRVHVCETGNKSGCVCGCVCLCLALSSHYHPMGEESHRLNVLMCAFSSGSPSATSEQSNTDTLCPALGGCVPYTKGYMSRFHGGNTHRPTYELNSCDFKPKYWLNLLSVSLDAD